MYVANFTVLSVCYSLSHPQVIYHLIHQSCPTLRALHPCTNITHMCILLIPARWIAIYMLWEMSMNLSLTDVYSVCNCDSYFLISTMLLATMSWLMLLLAYDLPYSSYSKDSCSSHYAYANTHLKPYDLCFMFCCSSYDSGLILC